MKIVAGLKAAAQTLVSRPQAASFRAGGKLVVCAHCENILFHKRKVSLNTAFSSLAGTEFADPHASVLVCANCSRLEWFNEDLPASEA